MDPALDAIKEAARKPIRVIARLLNSLTGGHLHPHVVTFTGLVMHLPIAYFIADGKLILAAILLIIFGLFDALDGELARLQKRASLTGMLFDSVTDRVKEIILYAGITYALVTSAHPLYAIWAAVAAGTSVLVSYINAWGDVVMTHNNSGHGVNKAFRGGLLRFEVRMFLLVLSLCFNNLSVFVVVVATLAWLTVVQRMILITRRLS